MIPLGRPYQIGFLPWLLTQLWFALRFVRRGRASVRKPDLDADVDSDFEELASDCENEDELRQWLSTSSFKSCGILPGETLIRKYLPPGTVMDLYEQYKATQSLLGAHAVSFLC